MKWIKASERLPGKGEIKFSRINGHLKCCIQLSVRTNKIHIAGDLIPTHYALDQIEWLDESESQDEREVLVALADLVSDLEQHYRAQKLLVSTHDKIRQAKIILSDTYINS